MRAALARGSMQSYFDGYALGVQAFVCGMGRLAPQAPLDFCA